ncbi:E3 ubiquitin-protein ligase IAP-3 [Frankliniella fusca]|uniref:E3 ubiquitin-protein ligase IAP-3 n=1 Tax=Frankliniella fusca TaxID=407009 RepID=A0AAE1HVP6_9NEOP|nr:E3 ubiquitin-protein ligase IAP-3 [Frankliniella fusca]
MAGLDTGRLRWRWLLPWPSHWPSRGLPRPFHSFAMTDEVGVTGLVLPMPEYATLGSTTILYRMGEGEKYECGLYKDGYNPLRTNEHMYKLGVTERYGKCYPQYKMKATRLRSFEGWPNEQVISAETLADCGFFWSQAEDKVICFWCGGGLKDWDAGDDPWVDHAKWFGRCSYVLERKGIDFVQSVHDQLFTGEVVIHTTSKAEETNMNTSCKICLEETVNTLFLPCRHLASCDVCASSVIQCVICRKSIEATVRVYIA